MAAFPESAVTLTGGTLSGLRPLEEEGGVEEGAEEAGASEGAKVTTPWPLRHYALVKPLSTTGEFDFPPGVFITMLPHPEGEYTWSRGQWRAGRGNIPGAGANGV